MLTPLKVCNLDIFRSLKAMAIAGETQLDYDLRVDMFFY